MIDQNRALGQSLYVGILLFLAKNSNLDRGLFRLTLRVGAALAWLAAALLDIQVSIPITPHPHIIGDNLAFRSIR